MYDTVRLAIPIRFLLDPPDEGAVTNEEGVARMAARIEALEAALREIKEACKLLLAGAHDYQSGIAEAEAAIAKAEGKGA